MTAVREPSDAVAQSTWLEHMRSAVEIAQIRYQGRNTSLQDVLRAQNVITEVDTELATVWQEAATARAALARQLPVSPETELRALPELPAATAPPRSNSSIASPRPPGRSSAGSSRPSPATPARSSSPRRSTTRTSRSGSATCS